MTFSNRPALSGHDLAMHLRAAYSFFRRRSSAELAPLGMSSDQFVVLTVLAKDGPASQQELVRRCHSDTTTMGTMLTLLETKGLVKRKAPIEDARTRIVSLTSAGKSLQKTLWNRSDALRAELAALFNPEETRVLLRFLNRIVEAMKPQARRSLKATDFSANQSRKQSSRTKAKRSYE